MKNYFYSNLSALNADLNFAVTAASSLSDYATTDSLTAYATQDDLTALATKDELSDYALSSDLSSYATTSYVDTKIGDINSILDSINGQVI